MCMKQNLTVSTTGMLFINKVFLLVSLFCVSLVGLCTDTKLNLKLFESPSARLGILCQQGLESIEANAAFSQFLSLFDL